MVRFEKAAFYLTCGLAVSIPISISLSQILLGAAMLALLLSRAPLRFPPIKLPLAAFIGWTVLALLFSGDPVSGLPQIRKLVLFLVPLVICSTFRTLGEIRAIVLIWGGVASLSACLSFLQFFRKYQQALALHKNFYNYYVAERITGFTSHWMTLGGEEMIVLLMLLAFLLFSNDRRWKPAGWTAAGILSISLALGMTRSIFLLGVPLGVLYLVWRRKRWLVALATPALGLALLIAPLRERIVSTFQPHGETDSNMHRLILRRTGWQVVKAHPWFGLGPEQMQPPKGQIIAPQLARYIPADIPRPLPEGWYGHLHNQYLQYAAERGVPALLAFLWMIGTMVRDLAAALGRRELDPEARFILHGATATIAGILAQAWFECNFGNSAVLTMFLSVVGCAYVAMEAGAGAKVVGQAIVSNAT